MKCKELLYQTQSRINTVNSDSLQHDVSIQNERKIIREYCTWWHASRQLDMEHTEHIKIAILHYGRFTYTEL